MNDRVRLTAAVSCLLAGLSLAGPVAKTPAQYAIPRPKTPIVIDGKLGEWDMAHTPHVLSGKGKDPLSKVVTDDPTHPLAGDADFSARVALAWDETYLYVAAAVADDHLRGIRPASHGNQGPPGWGCDSVMVSIASFRQPMKSNSPFHPMPLLGLRYAPTGPKPRGKLVGGKAVLDKRGPYWVLTRGSKWKVAETANGYSVEAAVPWKDLNYVARPGERLFISFLGADNDPGQGLVQLGWGFVDDAKAAPLFRLADRPDLLAVVTCALDEVPTDAPCIVRTELDALVGTATLDGVRVVDGTGKTVWQGKASMAVPQGMTGTDLREIPAGAVPKPGRYTVEALVKGAAVARVPIRVVEPVPEPPLVKNLPGEIHHMGPDRIAHNAYDENRRFFKHGFVKGKKDYVRYLRTHLEPGLKKWARFCIKSKFPHGRGVPMRCLAMHRITGDKEYAKLASGVVDYTLAAGGGGWFGLVHLIRYRYLTWKNDPNTPFAPKDAEKRFRAILAKFAAKPDKTWLNETGTHNRVWYRYALIKIARLVAEQDGVTVDPRVIEYTDYHDKLIGEVGDSDDASAVYHWVFFAPAVSPYFFTGDWDAFLKNRGFQKTLSRYVDMVSPSGACPPFASCHGWPSVGESMWAYELMSRLTRDGRYRWTAHRIAEYYYNHLDHRAAQYHGPYDAAINNFVIAYLLADDAVAPKPPTAKSRVTWRHPFTPVPLPRRKARPGTAKSEMDASRWIPDKVVLSSGTDAQSLWGLVELLPTAGHGGDLPGNIISLMVHDAALFAGQGYYEQTPDFQNLLWIEDRDGLAADPRPLDTQVPIFVDDPAFTFVRIRTTAYQHLPVTYTRDILFYKNGFVVVKDRAKFDTTMKVRVGPCYNARDLGPECGAHWFNTYYGQLYYTGLGLGAGVQAIRNPAWDLLVYFTPRAGRKHTVVDRYLDNPYRNSPVQLRQVWSGMVRAGQELTFTSVLLPHVPLMKPSSLLDPPSDSKDPKRIEVVHDDDGLTVVKVIGEMYPAHKRRYETWVMLNDTGKRAEAGPMSSDARVAIVGHNHNGAILHRAIVGGSALRYRGVDETARARKLKLTPLVMPAAFRK